MAQSDRLMGAAENIGLDLNATIVAAVNARIEAEMVAALSGDATIGAFVTAALRQTVDVKTGSYTTEKVPFLTVVLRKAIQDATEAAVRKLIAEELPTIEDEVRKALRRDVRGIAEGLTKTLADAATSAYGVKVNIALRMPSD